MTDQPTESDPLFLACDALLREIAGTEISTDRLSDALPVIRETIAAIREMDEVDVAGVEPATAFRLAGR